MEGSTCLQLSMQNNYLENCDQMHSEKDPKLLPYFCQSKVPLYGTSLVAQWLRICLPMQGTQVRALVGEDSTCRRANKPVCHNYWTCTLEPASYNYWAREPQLLSLRATTTEAHMPRSHAPQKEKPTQWEACAPQWRVAPAHDNQRKAHAQQQRPNVGKN